MGRNNQPAAIARTSAMIRISQRRMKGVLKFTHPPAIQTQKLLITAKYNAPTIKGPCNEVKSFTAMTKSMKPVVCLNSSIHRPDFGIFLSRPGRETNIA